MARAILDHEVLREQTVADPDLQIAASVAVTVYEINGTTLFTGTMYDAPTGGSVVPNPTATNSRGLLQLYTDPANARRVKLTVVGVASQVDSEFRLDTIDVMSLSTAQTVTGTKTGGGYSAATITDPIFRLSAVTDALAYQREINMLEVIPGLGDLTSTGDDTDAINTVLTFLRTRSVVPGVGVTLRFPAMRMRVGSLNFTKLRHLKIIGTNGATIFLGCMQSVAREGASRPVLDFAACQGVAMEGVQVFSSDHNVSGSPASQGKLNPTCLIYSGDISTLGWTPDALEFRWVGGDGRYCTVGGVILYRAADSQFYFLNPNMNDNTKPNLVLTDDLSGYAVNSWQTAASGAGQPMINCAFYSLGGHGVELLNVYNMNFYGGNISGNGMDSAVRIRGTLSEHIQFYGTQFNKGEGASPTSLALINCDAASIHSLAIHDPGILGPLVPGTLGFLKRAQDTLLKDLKITGLNARDMGAGADVILSGGTHTSGGGTVVIDGGEISCAGGDLIPGGSLQGVTVHKVGTYTKAASGTEANCLFIDPINALDATTSALILQNGVLRIPDGVTASPSVSYQADPDTGHARQGANIDSWIAGAAIQAEVSTAGLLPRRIVSTGLAAALVGGNFGAPSANWGTSASVGSIAGTEVAGRFIVTAGTAATGADPTLVLTFPGGAYPSPGPEVHIALISSSAAMTSFPIGVVRTTTTATFTFVFTPTANVTYTFSIMITG